MVNWDAITIQNVWFSADAHKLKAAELFETLTGAAPTYSNRNSSPTPANPRTSAAGGENDGAAYELSTQFGRVDLVVRRPPPEDQAGPELFQDTPAVVERVLAQVKRLSGVVPEINRLSLVLQLANLAGSHTDCTRLINEQIGRVVDFEDASDLMLQVNRRFTNPDVSPLEINRLLRFSVMKFQQIIFDQTLTSLNPLDSLHAAGLLLDINTSPTTRAIEVAEQNGLWDTIIGEAMRLRQVGSLRGLSNQ